MTASVSDETCGAPQERMRGKCKWFDGGRGFGFVEGSDKRDYFVHQTSIKSDTWRNLQINQDVEFEVVEDGKRLKAINVTSPGASHVKYKPKKRMHVCFEYKRGATCRYGNNCKFSHDLDDGEKSSNCGYSSTDVHDWSGGYNPPYGRRSTKAKSDKRVRKDICYSWLGGDCYRGEMCRYDHPDDEKNYLFLGAPKEVCYQWQEGKCRRGEQCSFFHFPTE